METEFEKWLSEVNTKIKSYKIKLRKMAPQQETIRQTKESIEDLEREKDFQTEKVCPKCGCPTFKGWCRSCDEYWDLQKLIVRYEWIKQNDR